MQKLVLGALVAALCGLPVAAQADTPVPYFLAAPSDRDARRGTAQQSEAGDYAARENVSPQLAAFAGGDNNGIYIGGGALAIALAIVLLVVLL